MLRHSCSCSLDEERRCTENSDSGSGKAGEARQGEAIAIRTVSGLFRSKKVTF